VNEHTFLINLGIALLAALVGGVIARMLRLPVLVGYLIAGIAVGPHTPGVIASSEAVNIVAKLGVVLLMFAVGVHFSLDELQSVRRIALIGGATQILGTIALGWLLGLALGWGVYGGLFLGCALSLSSTVVMLKVLEERGEQGTTHGKVMLGILVVQDLTLVAMISLLPALATVSTQGFGAFKEVGFAVLKATLFIAATVLLAMRLVPAMLHRIARFGSPELFLVAVVCACLVTATAAEYAGLGIELGAFMAGIVVSESDYAHEVFAQIRPLRDVFASLFFVSIGMLLNPGFLAQHLLEVTLVVLLIVVGKALVSFLAVYALGAHGRTALFAGLGLAQIGEFSFVLATVGSSRGIIPAEIANVILSSALITLLLAPFLFQAAGPLYARLNRTPALSYWLNRQGEAPEEIAEKERAAARVLVLGYGRIGRYVSDALQAKDVPHLVVDYDANALKRLQETGVTTLYGDASSPTVLEQTHPKERELAIVALPEADVSEMTVRALKRLAPDLQVVARVHRGNDIPMMRKAGADAIIHAEFEAGTEMIRQCLDRLGFADMEVDTYILAVRQHRYRVETERV
jgi:monovalent cation:H+ antiporter-2, CPA2 family